MATRDQRLSNLIDILNEIENDSELTQSSTPIIQCGVIHYEASTASVFRNRKYISCYLREDLLKIKNIVTHKFISDIKANLKSNCPLWFCNCKKSQTGKAIRELAELRVLIKLNNNVFFVNPLKISFGHPCTVIAAFFQYLNSKKMPLSSLKKDDIVSYKKPKQGSVILLLSKW
jgi:hypothetical protein